MSVSLMNYSTGVYKRIEPAAVAVKFIQPFNRSTIDYEQTNVEVVEVLKF